jgi:putative endonuclease
MNKVYSKSFTAKYHCVKLVWYDTYPNISDAIEREKQIKAGSRAVKEKLINEVNPLWRDLWEIVGQW